MFGGSFITDIFGGQIKSTLVCQICNKERDSYETINNLSLPLARPQHNNVVDIVDCFRSFFAPEQLEDLLTCDHCKTKTPTVKFMKLWIFPKVLILHLKRYTVASPSGLAHINNAMVETSENLVFRAERQPNEVRYNLKCIVNHFGANPNSGHYTTLCVASVGDRTTLCVASVVDRTTLCVAWLRHGDRTTFGRVASPRRPYDLRSRRLSVVRRFALTLSHTISLNNFFSTYRTC